MVLSAARILATSVAAAAIVAAGMAADVETTLGLLPFLVVMVPLLAGRYLGEERIATLAQGRRPVAARRRPGRDGPAPRRRGATTGASGGLLVARRAPLPRPRPRRSPCRRSPPPTAWPAAPTCRSPAGSSPGRQASCSSSRSSR
jgi:hypothetical protein